MTSIVLCPHCRKVVPRESELRPVSFPFCTERCRMSDLGKWLQEDYTISSAIDPGDHESIEEVLSSRQAES